MWGSMVAGAAAVAAFLAWTRRTSAPLIDLRLFRDRRFVGGVFPSTLMTFALFGVLFAVPQYLQAVLGSDALGTGLRLLPLIGGLIVTGRISPRLVERLGTRVVVVGGLLMIVVAATVGAFTSADDGYGFVAAWLTIIGLGMGLTIPASMTIAMNALTAERGGTGSALLMTSRLIGGAFGSAVMGSLLSAGYRSHVDVTGLAEPAADAVRRGLGGGVAVAGRLGDPALLESVRAAFVHGMDLVLAVGAGILVVTAAVTLILLPRRAAEAGAPAHEGAGESEHEHLSA